MFDTSTWLYGSSGVTIWVEVSTLNVVTWLEIDGRHLQLCSVFFYVFFSTTRKS
jgi:hypothetical protein